MTANSKHQVAIIEDNLTLGGSLRKVIDSSEDLACIGVWPTAEEGLRKIEAFRPEAVLMDINLPGISGIEATGFVRQHFPEIQIVMITVYGDHDKIFAALKAGATGYLLKRSSPSDIRDAVRTVLAGGAPMSPVIARRIVDAFHQSRRNLINEADLSQREYQVLELLVEGISNKELAQRLNITTDTVRVHLRNIYDKLHVHTRLQAATKLRDCVWPGKHRGPLVS